MQSTMKMIPPTTNRRLIFGLLIAGLVGKIVEAATPSSLLRRVADIIEDQQQPDIIDRRELQQVDCSSITKGNVCRSTDGCQWNGRTDGCGAVVTPPPSPEPTPAPTPLPTIGSTPQPTPAPTEAPTSPPTLPPTNPPVTPGMGYCSDGSSECLTVDVCACATDSLEAIFERRSRNLQDCPSISSRKDCTRTGGCQWNGQPAELSIYFQ